MNETQEILDEVETVIDSPVVVAAPAQPMATASDMPPVTGKKNWYVIKVTAGREETIRDAIERRIKIENLEPY